MYDYRCNDCEKLGQNMPMMPMMNMPMYDEDDEEDDEDLKNMYPKIYIVIYPMVKNYCDMIESRYGTMCCPSKDEMDNMCKEVCDKYEKHYRDDDDGDMRDTLREGRRGPIQDLTRVLFIRDLGRRRRRRMFHHGY